MSYTIKALFQDTLEVAEDSGLFRISTLERWTEDTADILIQRLEAVSLLDELKHLLEEETDNSYTHDGLFGDTLLLSREYNKFFQYGGTSLFFNLTITESTGHVGKVSLVEGEAACLVQVLSLLLKRGD